MNTMRKFLLIAITALVCFGSALYGKSSKNKDDGTPAGWLTNVEEAIKIAEKENKSVLILFTGSDWCGFCVRLHDNVLVKNDFKKLLKKKIVAVYLDFPRRKSMTEDAKKYNRALAQKYGVRGFPTTIILNKKGEETGRLPGYAPDYVKRVKKMLK